MWAAGAKPRFRAGAALVIHLAMMLFLEIGVVVNRSIINHSELVDAQEWGKFIDCKTPFVHERVNPW